MRITKELLDEALDVAVNKITKLKAEGTFSKGCRECVAVDICAANNSEDCRKVLRFVLLKQAEFNIKDRIKEAS
jgi:hypothetical protein